MCFPYVPIELAERLLRDLKKRDTLKYTTSKYQVIKTDWYEVATFQAEDFVGD